LQMENIQRALNRAQEAALAPGVPLQFREETRFSPASAGIREVRLKRETLERERIVAHDRMDERCKSFDMLRTQVLQTMDTQQAQTLAVTSPTAGCGKTVNALNLAMAIARQPERSVLLIDLDLNGPQIARRLGIACDVGLIDVLDGTVAYQDALVQARVSGHELLVLPSKGTSAGEREWPSAKTLGALLKDLKQEDRSRVIIVDLPPLLSGDEVISVLPYVDGVMFVVSAGLTTQVHLKECAKHLQDASIIRVVLNRSPEPGIAPYGYAAGEGHRRPKRFWRR
jgi:Mrp family chromosome partitioning ATPase